MTSQEKRGSHQVENPNRSYNSSNPDISFMNDEYEKIGDFHVGIKPVPFGDLWNELDKIPWQKLKHTPVPPILAESPTVRPLVRVRIGSVPDISKSLLRPNRKGRPKPRGRKKKAQSKNRTTRLIRKTLKRRKSAGKIPNSSSMNGRFVKQRSLNEVEDVPDSEETNLPKTYIRPEITAPRDSVLNVKPIGSIPPPMVKNFKSKTKLPPSYNPHQVHSLLGVNSKKKAVTEPQSPGRVSLKNIKLVDRNNNASTSSGSLKKLRQRHHLGGGGKSSESLNSSGGRVTLRNIRLVESLKDTETVTDSVVSENRTIFEEEIPPYEPDDEIDI